MLKTPVVITGWMLGWLGGCATHGARCDEMSAIDQQEGSVAVRITPDGSSRFEAAGAHAEGDLLDARGIPHAECTRARKTAIAKRIQLLHRRSRWSRNRPNETRREAPRSELR
jgi:hypothetical protein